MKANRFWMTAALCTLPMGLLWAQDPVIGPEISIDQNTLLKNCPVATAPGCQYALKKVLSSGGQIYSTPFLPWDAATSTGDGHGEGPNGPRAGQRHRFNPFNPNYPYLRLNGIDSQSCFECHNSIGSSIQSYGAALMRKPYAVGGSAGSNSNAFINPLFPTDDHDGPLTLFIRNPPHVFGTGYTQELGYELTTTLWLLKAQTRASAMKQPGRPASTPLIAGGLDFGVFTTTYNGANAPAVMIADASCPAAKTAPTNVGGAAGYTDDVTKVKGVPCDLVVRPFQWKGVSSSVRHFARDALDFHFSMQVFEKAAKCDCDGDGLAPELGQQPSVSIGNVSALVSFVTMMRPPVQAPRDPEAQRGYQIFTGAAANLPVDAGTRKMCATCHVTSLKALYPYVRVEWPTNPNDSEAHPIDPNTPSTWPVLEKDCPNGKPSSPNVCPAETAYGAAPNPGALVTPALSSFQLPAVRGVVRGLTALPQAGSIQAQVVAIRRQTLVPGFPDYVVPLSAPAAVLTNLQVPRLPANSDGTVDVPLFSDLQTHEMGSCLSDPTVWNGVPLPAQGTDVAGINTVPSQFLTRPLWGVADTGPWLHDGRARTLREAILMHGDSVIPSCTGSSAEPVIKVFRGLSPQDQQAVVKFLLTLRLPSAAQH
jgi:Di-haem oxidoreductase, putative peroxidase